jgi:predicted metal-dependent hydrolase
MSTKLVHVDQVGPVEFIKKRGLRSIRLRVDPQGVVKVSLPWLVSHQFAVNFVASRRDWIEEQRSALTPFEPWNGMQFGKSFTLYITELSPTMQSRIHTSKLQVSVVGQLDFSDEAQMTFIQKAMLRALRKDAENCLLPRVEQLASRHRVIFQNSRAKQLTGRWGSCDTHGVITLSLFLTQLPWDLIDYVITHELAHVGHMNHSAKFWNAVGDMYPDYKQARSRLKAWQPRVYAGEVPS